MDGYRYYPTQRTLRCVYHPPAGKVTCIGSNGGRFGPLLGASLAKNLLGNDQIFSVRDWLRCWRNKMGAHTPLYVAHVIPMLTTLMTTLGISAKW